eukprot:m.33879 g.33879  ORF g.33879 m.33879 type:complete len:157 (+) comp9688_c0_seq2:563-1033(+)
MQERSWLSGASHNGQLLETHLSWVVNQSLPLCFTSNLLRIQTMITLSTGQPLGFVQYKLVVPCRLPTPSCVHSFPESFVFRSLTFTQLYCLFVPPTHNTLDAAPLSLDLNLMTAQSTACTRQIVDSAMSPCLGVTMSTSTRYFCITKPVSLKKDCT